MYFYVYKIINFINNKIYIGKRTSSILPELDIKYMGSGKLIKNAIKKYGLENFKKEILSIFKSEEEAFKYEKELVNEDFLKRDDVYNLNIGGYGSWLISNIKNKEYHKNSVIVKDKNNIYYKVSKLDERYLNGDLVDSFKDCVMVKDNKNNTFKVSINDERYLSGELKHICTDTIVVKNNDNNLLRVNKNDIKYLNGELNTINKNTLIVKDSYGSNFRVSLYDERYLSGELISIHKGKKISDETKKLYKLFQETRRKKVVQKTLDDKIVKIYNYINETKLYGFEPTHVSKCCNGKMKTHKKYKWEFLIN